MDRSVKIKKGRHAPGILSRIPRLIIQPHRISSVGVSVSFSKSCFYTIPPAGQEDNANWLDINKACGISFGDHRRCSARIGWLPNKDGESIRLYGYARSNGKILFSELPIKIPKVQYGFMFDIDIIILDGMVLFQQQETNATQVSIGMDISKSPIGYTLGPYFGGDLLSPTDIGVSYSIKINR